MQPPYYDPVASRFLSVDPQDMMSMNLNPGYFNRYMYTMNNPVNNIDPTGMACEGFGDGCTIGPINEETGEFTFQEQHQLSSDTVEGINDVFVPLSLAMSFGNPGASFGRSASLSGVVGDVKAAVTTVKEGVKNARLARPLVSGTMNNVPKSAVTPAVDVAHTVKINGQTFSVGHTTAKANPSVATSVAPRTVTPTNAPGVSGGPITTTVHAATVTGVVTQQTIQPALCSSATYVGGAGC